VRYHLTAQMTRLSSAFAAMVLSFFLHEVAGDVPNMSNTGSLLAYLGCEPWCIWVPEASWQWVYGCQGCHHDAPTPAPGHRTCWLSDGGCAESVIDDGHWPAGKCWPTRSECAQHSQSFCFTREGSFCVPIKQAPSGSCYATKDQCLTAAPTSTCWLIDGGCTESVINHGQWPSGKCWPSRPQCETHLQDFCFAREGSFCIPIKQAPSGSCYATQNKCLEATSSNTRALGSRLRGLSLLNSLPNSTANSTLMASSMEAANWPDCAAEHAQCGKPFPWAWWEKACCSGFHCEQLLGGTGRVCVKSQPTCVPANSICGGPGQLTQECCGRATCRKFYGGDQMKCVEPTSPPCWSFNGGTCVNVQGAGPETKCHSTFRDCYQSSPGAACWSWNGAICVSVVGAQVSQCFESVAHCRQASSS